jgi:hypothetical protein
VQSLARSSEGRSHGVLCDRRSVVAGIMVSVTKPAPGDQTSTTHHASATHLVAIPSHLVTGRQKKAPHHNTRNHTPVVAQHTKRAPVPNSAPVIVVPKARRSGET